MNKQIFTIGYEIPGQINNLVDFYSEQSLMDADILLISPDSLYPRGDWVSFTTSDGGCYNVEASRKYKQKMSHLKKEIQDHLNSGKNIFILLSQKEDDCLADNVSTLKKGQNTYSTETYSNYNFLPINIGTLTSASGKHIEFSGNPIFYNFYKKFKENLEYQVYLEDVDNAKIVFTGKNKTKILGAVYKLGSGHLVTLPYLNYNKDEFTKYKKDKKGGKTGYWTKDAIKFGNILCDCLLEIDRGLTQESIKTPLPTWVLNENFNSKTEIIIQNDINKNIEEIKKIEQENNELQMKLQEEQALKDLLYEQGKPLENAVIKALEILGFKAKNYNDGILELDQVITSPERYRYIGECEGKDSKVIDITKFRQLSESMSADFDRKEVSEKAFGILFGNAERLIDPNKRTLDFTKKCKIGAEREKISLVKTIDLFIVTKYLKEYKDDKFQLACRGAIHDGLGGIVKFPDIPQNK